jgi:hypothetical protein
LDWFSARFAAAVSFLWLRGLRANPAGDRADLDSGQGRARSHDHALLLAHMCFAPGLLLSCMGAGRQQEGKNSDGIEYF